MAVYFSKIPPLALSGLSIREVRRIRAMPRGAILISTAIRRHGKFCVTDPVERYQKLDEVSDRTAISIELLSFCS